MAFVEITIPAMGEGIIEATIIRWLVKPGEPVTVDMPLVEIATDKVDSEISSGVNGTLSRILRVEGEIPKVGEVIALVLPEGAAIPDTHSQDSPANEAGLLVVDQPVPSPPPIKEALTTAGRKESPAPSFEAAPADTNLLLSPFVKKLAEDLHLTLDELGAIQGTSSSARITRDDLYAYIDRKRKGLVQSPSDRAAREPVPAIKSLSKEQIYNTEHYELVQMDRMRRLIAEHMVNSRNIAPHVTSFHEADLTELVSWRAREKDVFFKQYGERLSYTTLFIAAIAKALKEFPMINVSVDGEQIIVKKDINIGMATAIPDGNLVVPVIKNADQLNLPGLAEKVNDLAVRAREGRLQPQEIKGGTFTLTNLGMFGSLTGTPIINQPESAILAAGAILQKPAVVHTGGLQGIGIRDICMFSLSYDHRVIDGALGGMFLQRIVRILEAPSLLVI